MEVKFANDDVEARDVMKDGKKIGEERSIWTGNCSVKMNRWLDDNGKFGKWTGSVQQKKGKVYNSAPINEVVWAAYTFLNK
jgi:hypothetical protein